MFGAEWRTIGFCTGLSIKLGRKFTVQASSGAYIMVAP